jgi:hypothetical protein
MGGKEVPLADRIKIEIGGRLVPILLRLSQEQGRDPDEVIEEALSLYLRESDVELGPSIGKPIREIYVEPAEKPERSRDGFLALLDRMSSRFDLDDPDEAMRIAVEEQHAFRRERRAAREEAER